MASLLRVQKILSQLNPNPTATVLIYGDSCTWGYRADPNDETERINEAQRWPVILEKKLNSTRKNNKSYRIIAEGLNGRTINEDTFLEFGSDKVNMNGYQQFLPIIHSHKPIDIIIFMLGVNNTKKEFNPSSIDIAMQMKKLIELAINSDNIWRDLSNKTVIFIAPAAVNEVNDINCEWGFNEKSIEISYDLSKQYAKIAEELRANCDSTTAIKFLSAPIVGVVTGNDSVHLDVSNNKRLAHAVYELV